MVDFSNLHPKYSDFTKAYNVAFKAYHELLDIKKGYGFLNVNERKHKAIDTLFQSQLKMQDLTLELLTASDLNKEDKIDYATHMNQYFKLLNRYMSEAIIPNEIQYQEIR